MMILRNLKILMITALAVLLVPILVPTFSPVPSGPKPVSYNPPPADIVHSPLSGMGLLRFSLARPNFNSSALTVSAPGLQNNHSNGTRTINQDAIRFINDTSYFSQSETSIAVDPGNTSHVLGGFNDEKLVFCNALPGDCVSSGSPASLSGFTVSIDGGASVLKGSDLPQMADPANPGFPIVPFGDPALAPSLDGNFFYASLGASPLGGVVIIIAKSNPNLFNPNVSCVTLRASPTVNACWQDVFVFGTANAFLTFSFEDKPVVAVDRSNGPFSGSVYIAWNHFDLLRGLSTSFLARCSNDLSSCPLVAGGTLPPVSDVDRFADFATPAVDENGNVFATWCNIGTRFTFGPVTCNVRSSPPGGESFSATSVILSFMGPSTMLPNDSFIRGFATEQFRTSSIPWLTVDTSSTPNSGNLYFAIPACTSGGYIALRDPFVGFDNPGNCGLSAIIFTRSNNLGTTWSTPVTVSQPAVNTQPFITVDPVTGHLFVVYYTTQFDPFNHRIDVVASRSTDGGLSFRQIRVTTVSNEPDSDPNMFFYESDFGGSWVVPQYGDYFQATAFGGTLWVLFTANYAVEQGTFQTDPFLAVVAHK